SYLRCESHQTSNRRAGASDLAPRRTVSVRLLLVKVRARSAPRATATDTIDLTRRSGCAGGSVYAGCWQLGLARNSRLADHLLPLRSMTNGIVSRGYRACEALTSRRGFTRVSKIEEEMPCRVVVVVRLIVLRQSNRSKVEPSSRSTS